MKQVIMLKSFNEPEGVNQKIVGLGRQSDFFVSSRLVVRSIPVKGIVAIEDSVDVSVDVSVHVECQCENDKVVG